MFNSVQPHRCQPTRLPHPWDSPGKNTGVGCHFLLQCMKVKSEREVAQSCPTLSDPMDCSPPGSSTHGIFQARVLEWGATALVCKKNVFLTKSKGKAPTTPAAGRAIQWVLLCTDPQDREHTEPPRVCCSVSASCGHSAFFVLLRV